MSGTPKLKTPKNDAEWARNQQKRVESLENPTSVRVGEWVLSTSSETGNLIGSHVDGGSVVLAVKPAASQNPDEVAATRAPFIRLERQATQNEPRGSTALVRWDTVSSQTQDWGFSAPGTDLDIPVSGLYEVQYHLAYLNASDVTSKATFFINGTVKMAQEVNPEDTTDYFISFYMAEKFNLNSGDIISCGAYVAGGGTFDFGHSSADPEVYTSLTVELISKEEG